MGCEPRLAAALERALALESHGPLIVTAAPATVAKLRASAPAATIAVVGISRALVADVLDAGADFALAGRLRPAELRARLRALSRSRDACIAVGPLTIDVAARVVLLDGAPLALAPGEFELLRVLAAARGQVVVKAALRRVHGQDSSRSLERQVARLRRRLGARAPMLVTVWGIGYRLDTPA